MKCLKRWVFFFKQIWSRIMAYKLRNHKNILDISFISFCNESMSVTCESVVVSWRKSTVACQKENPETGEFSPERRFRRHGVKSMPWSCHLWYVDYESQTTSKLKYLMHKFTKKRSLIDAEFCSKKLYQWKRILVRVTPKYLFYCRHKK